MALPKAKDMAGYQPGGGEQPAPQATPEPVQDEPEAGVAPQGEEPPAPEANPAEDRAATPPPAPTDGEEDPLQFDGDMVPKAVFLERLTKLAKQRDEFKGKASKFEQYYSPERLQQIQNLEQFDQQLGAILTQDAWIREVLQARMEGRQPNWNMVQKAVEQAMGQQLPAPGQDQFDQNDPYIQQIRAVQERQQMLERQIMARQQQAEVQQASAYLDREIADFSSKNPLVQNDQEFVMQALAKARADRTTFTKAAESLVKWVQRQRDSALVSLKTDQRRRDGAKPGGPAGPAAVPVAERPKIGSKEEKDQMMAWADRIHR